MVGTGRRLLGIWCSYGISVVRILVRNVFSQQTISRFGASSVFWTAHGANGFPKGSPVFREQVFLSEGVCCFSLSFHWGVGCLPIDRDEDDDHVWAIVSWARLFWDSLEVLLSCHRLKSVNPNLENTGFADSTVWSYTYLRKGPIIR